MNDLAEGLPEERVRLDSEAGTREEVLEVLARLLEGRDEALRRAVRDDLVARERISSTGVGGGVAFPHARLDSLLGIRLAFLRTTQPVEFRAMDGKGVDLFLAVAGSVEDRREYLSVLGRVSYLFRSAAVREDFRRAASAREVRDLVRRCSPDSAGRS